MASVIYRPCYATREQVRRAVDIKLAAYDSERIDRACLAGTDAVEQVTQRRFYPEDKTCTFDWPNFQYAYPWRLWLDDKELAVAATSIVSGTYLTSPVSIPIANVIFQPVNQGPPFTSIELRRDLNSFFGSNTTPQNDIGITGTFGYWLQTRAAGTTAASVGLGDATVTVSDSSLFGPGDVIIIDSERMLVTDHTFVATSSSFSVGITAASMADTIGTVALGTAFNIGEVIQVDYEWMLIQNIVGNNLVVKRAWEGSQIATHTNGTTIFARRSASVLRGQLGTTAATHNNGANILVTEVPGLVREYAIAEAVVWLTQETAAYAGMSGPQKQTSALRSAGSLENLGYGAGLPDLRCRLENSRYTRKARSRVI